MSKKNIKILTRVIVIVLGIILVIISNVFEDKFDNVEYVSGFGTGLIFITAIMLLRDYRINSNEDLKKKVEIAQKDERNIEIYLKATSLTFRISVVFQALALVIFTIINNSVVMIFNIIIGIEILMYLIIYYIYSKKI